MNTASGIVQGYTRIKLLPVIPYVIACSNAKMCGLVDNADTEPCQISL